MDSPILKQFESAKKIIRQRVDDNKVSKIWPESSMKSMAKILLDWVERMEKDELARILNSNDKN